MRAIRIAIALLAFSSSAYSQDEAHHDHQAMGAADAATSASTAPIRLTINPEARVSVEMVGTVPPAVRCGSALDLSVEVVNQGFVTAPLEAALVGTAPAGVTLYLDREPLTGVPTETRVLHVTLTQPGQTDLTVAFRARNEIPDLGGRDRVHFLAECRQSAA